MHEDPPPMIFVAHGQIPRLAMTVSVRTGGDPMGMSITAQKQTNALDSELPITNIRTLDQYMVAAVAEVKFGALLLGLFAVLVLLLTSVGLYGVQSYALTQRTRELGIRVALGAQSRAAPTLVIRQRMGLALFGAAIGIPVSAALALIMKGWLFGVNNVGPSTYTGVGLLLTIVSLISCWIPARRAAKVDPMLTLRNK